MNIAHLEYFVATVKYGGFAAASRELYITPQALCRAVGDLERRLGVDLFEKVGRNIDPTPFGLRFYAKAQEVLESIIDLEMFAKEETSQQSESRHVSVAVAATVMRGSVFGPDDFDDLLSCNSTGTYSFLFNTNGTCLSALQDEIVDAAIVFGRVNDESIACMKLFSFVPMIAMGREHPLAVKTHLRGDDLASFPIAAPTDLKYCYSAILEFLCSRGIKRDFSNVPFTKEGTSKFFADGGLAFVIDSPEMVNDYPSAMLRSLSPEDSLEIPVCFAYRASKRGIAMSKLKDYLIDISIGKCKERGMDG